MRFQKPFEFRDTTKWPVERTFLRFVQTSIDPAALRQRILIQVLTNRFGHESFSDIPRRAETIFASRKSVSGISTVFTNSFSHKLVTMRLILAFFFSILSFAAPSFTLPDDVVPKKYTVDLTIDPSKDSFDGQARIDVELKRSTNHIWINAKDLTPMEASVGKTQGSRRGGGR